MDSYIFKVIVLGNSNVGKTSLMNKYVTNIFTHHTKYTIGVEIGTKKISIGDELVTLNIWDTAGQERYNSLCRLYYLGSDCCALVYDVTDAHSFENLDYWYNQFVMYSVSKDIKEFPLVLIGNKVDLPCRAVSALQAEEWCSSKHQCSYFETSAKDGINVDFAFESCAQIAFRRKVQPTHFPGDCVFPKKQRKLFNRKMC